MIFKDFNIWTRVSHIGWHLKKNILDDCIVLSVCVWACVCVCVRVFVCVCVGSREQQKKSVRGKGDPARQWQVEERTN